METKGRRLCSENERSPNFIDKHDFIPANRSQAKKPLKNDNFINHLEEYDRKKQIEFQEKLQNKRNMISGAFKSGKVPVIGKQSKEVLRSEEFKTFLEQKEQMPRLSIL